MVAYMETVLFYKVAPGFNTLKKLVDGSDKNFMEKVFDLQFSF